MAYEIPEKEPIELQAGSSWFWNTSFGDYPASAGWQLVFFLRGPKDLNVVWTTHVTADGDAFQVRIPATDSAPITPGPYRLIGRVDLAGEVHEVYNEHLLVLADPLTAVDAQSRVKILLDAIRSALDGRLTAAQREIQINGRRVVYFDSTELRALEAEYSLLYEIERSPHARLTHEVHAAR